MCFSLVHSLLAAADTFSTRGIHRLHLLKIHCWSLSLSVMSTMEHPIGCYRLRHRQWTKSAGRSSLLSQIMMSNQSRIVIQTSSMSERWHVTFVSWKFSRCQQVLPEFACSLSSIKSCQLFRLCLLLQLVDLPAFSSTWRQYCCTLSQSVMSRRWPWTL